MSKWEDFKNNVRMKWDKACEWCYENPMLSMILIPSAIGAVGTIATATAKSIKTKSEEKKRTMQIYDPEMGQYLDLKRPLKVSEKVELAERHRAGENITLILDDMNRLK